MHGRRAEISAGPEKGALFATRVMPSASTLRFRLVTHAVSNSSIQADGSGTAVLAVVETPVRFFQDVFEGRVSPGLLNSARRPVARWRT